MHEILIVEDDEGIRECLQEVLADRYRVDVASNGVEALQKILANPSRFSVLVVDILMPVLDGPGLLRELRKAGLFIPTILMSASSVDVDVVPGLRRLDKPFELDELHRAIESCLTGQAATL